MTSSKKEQNKRRLRMQKKKERRERRQACKLKWNNGHNFSKGDGGEYSHWCRWMRWLWLPATSPLQLNNRVTMRVRARPKVRMKGQKSTTYRSNSGARETTIAPVSFFFRQDYWRIGEGELLGERSRNWPGGRTNSNQASEMVCLILKILRDQNNFWSQIENEPLNSVSIWDREIFTVSICDRVLGRSQLLESAIIQLQKTVSISDQKIFRSLIMVST